MDYEGSRYSIDLNKDMKFDEDNFSSNSDELDKCIDDYEYDVDIREEVMSMTFESVNEADEFHNQYAKTKSFRTRKYNKPYANNERPQHDVSSGHIPARSEQEDDSIVRSREASEASKGFEEVNKEEQEGSKSETTDVSRHSSKDELQRQKYKSEIYYDQEDIAILVKVGLEALQLRMIAEELNVAAR
ncbi:hypothetical protein ACH5RR_015491 [Cinchona calisaya]|uniref:Uncharacterized protein n=1 Tax=Cinchona calisaya TaxID=153742 RepID=A0ABD2ZTB0_9GENT